MTHKKLPISKEVRKLSGYLTGIAVVLPFITISSTTPLFSLAIQIAFHPIIMIILLLIQRKSEGEYYYE